MVALLNMANTLINNVEGIVMNEMVAKLDIQDIAGMEDMVNI